MIEGFRLWPGRLDREGQSALVEAILGAAQSAPFYRPTTPGGAMSVEMTNLGDLGWVSDRTGYRYSDRHPVTGAPWPAMPKALLDLWTDLAQAAAPPDVCLVNLYRPGARMGLHQDKDEADFSHPVLSISLGDTALFRLGGLRRSDPTVGVRLTSGDVCGLFGKARLAFHGVDRIIAGSSSLIPGGGRMNLTLRRAAAWATLPGRTQTV